MPKIKIKDLDSTEKGPGHDMQLYFNGTYLRVSLDGVTSAWAKYHGLKSDGWHHFSTIDGPLKIETNHPQATVEWAYPTGWFNFKTTAIFCSRVPKRQYSKGLCSANFEMSSAQQVAKDLGLLQPADAMPSALMNALAFFAASHKFQISPDSLHELFMPQQFPDFVIAYTEIKSRKAFARALTKDFALMPHPSTKDLLFLCHDYPIAEILNPHKLKMLSPMFKSECQEFFHNKGVTVTS